MRNDKVRFVNETSRIQNQSDTKRRMKYASKCVLLLMALLVMANFSFSQNRDSTKVIRHFSGAITATTNGISTFPNLTLGKPAVLFDMSMGGEKFRFEPTLRFGLVGKPWTFVFWLRYELLKTEKFQLKISAHPAYSFKTITVTENGKTSQILRTQQFLACEFAPVLFIAKGISAGPYYIYAKGVSDGAVQNSNFISFRMNFSNIELSEKYYIKLMAQAYYLQMDANDGFYINSTLSANHRNFPLSVSSTVNKTIESTIEGKDFLWNLSLTWSFGGRYKKI